MTPSINRSLSLHRSSEFIVMGQFALYWDISVCKKLEDLSTHIKVKQLPQAKLCTASSTDPWQYEYRH